MAGDFDDVILKLEQIQKTTEDTNTAHQIGLAKNALLDAENVINMLEKADIVHTAARHLADLDDLSPGVQQEIEDLRTLLLTFITLIHEAARSFRTF